MKYTRLWADDGGESHFEEVDINFESVDFAPPAPPLDIADLGLIGGCSIMRAKPGWLGDWHQAPFRQWHLYLAGEVEAEASDGEVRRIRAGSIALVEDTTGKGHRSRVVGNGEAVIVVVNATD